MPSHEYVSGVISVDHKYKNWGAHAVGIEFLLHYHDPRDERYDATSSSPQKLGRLQVCS